MRKLIYAIICICFLSQALYAQKELTQLEKLTATAKVWGFLKYYHPNVANGTYNWDQQLFDILPKVESVKTNTELSAVFLNWINTLGKIKPCKSCSKLSKKEYFNENFDLSWIKDNSIFSGELSNKLEYIEKNRLLKKHFYVKYGLNDEANPINEEPYEDIGFPDLEYRLLSLFRYWNFIEYFFPHKYLTDQKWSEVLLDFIEKMLDTSIIENYQLILTELVTKLDDSHVSIRFDKDIKFKYSSTVVKDIEGECVVFKLYNETIAEQEDIKLGDVIIAVDDINVKDYLEKQIKYQPASNIITKRNNVYYSLLRSDVKESLEVTIRRGDTILNRKVDLYDFYELYRHNLKNSSKWKIVNTDIGYVDMRLIDSEDVQEMMINLTNTKAIIFDLRGYPKFAFKQLSRYLISEKKDFAKIMIPDLTYPGKYLFKENDKTYNPVKNLYKGKVIILADDQSLSLSEYAVMCLQAADNSITIGSQTAAADGKNILFVYLGGYQTTMTSQGVFYPDGTQTQRVGVKIDIEVKPTIKGLQEGRDEVLEKAIEIINN